MNKEIGIIKSVEHLEQSKDEMDTLRLKYEEDEGIIKSVEYLEQSKDEMDTLRLKYEEDENWERSEAMDGYIERIQAIIDELSGEDELSGDIE